MGNWGAMRPSSVKHDCWPPWERAPSPSPIKLGRCQDGTNRIQTMKRTSASLASCLQSSFVPRQGLRGLGWERQEGGDPRGAWCSPHRLSQQPRPHREEARSGPRLCLWVRSGAELLRPPPPSLFSFLLIPKCSMYLYICAFLKMLA